MHYYKVAKICNKKQKRQRDVVYKNSAKWVIFTLSLYEVWIILNATKIKYRIINKNIELMEMLL